MEKQIKALLVIVLASISFSAWADDSEIDRDYSSEIAEVNAFLADHEIDTITSYCFVGQLNCRSVVFYKDKVTGERVRSFEDRFMASTVTRSVASRGFVLEQSNGNFNMYAQDTFKNEIAINQVQAENQDIAVNFDADGYPSFELKFLIVGTSDLKIATLTYTSHWAEFTGDIKGRLIVKP